MNREITIGKYIINKLIFLNMKNSFGKNAIFCFGNSKENCFIGIQNHI